MTGKVFVAVGRVHIEFKGLAVELSGLIYLVLPAGGAAVQAMAEIVLRQLHRVAVDDEAAVVDAVGIAAYRCAEVGGHVLVVGDVVKTQNYIAQLAVAVGYHE